MSDPTTGWVEVYERPDGKYDWVRKDAQGRVLSGSMQQGYENLSDVVEMAMRLNPGITVRKVGRRDGGSRPEAE